MEAIHARLGVSDEQIAEFCRKWNIVRLELFGSVLRDDFDEQSDVDLLVTFRDPDQHGLRELLDMEGELQAMFGRHVDLIERHLIETSRNWIRRRSILSSAQVVYAAA